MSSKCYNIKLAIRNDKSEIVYAMCKQCLITVNHDACVLNYVNDMNSRRKKQKANVYNLANQTKHKVQIWKPKNVGPKERLASPKPSKPRMRLMWLPTGKMKFLGTVRFGNDHVAAILGFGDLQWENILITRVYFVEGLRHNLTKDEAPEEIKTFLKRITVLLQAHVIIAEAIATTCYTQNRSIIHRRFDKTPYELINGRKLDIFFLHVFGALCYPKNNREDIGKLGAKGDIGFFISFSANSCAYRVYDRRTKKIIETMNVTFNELSTMAFEQNSLKPGLQSMTSGHISSGLDLLYAPSTITTQKPTEGELDLLFEAMYDDHVGGQPSAALRTVLAAQAP
ncbi:retrovirus-related pol polyprotein from transposon TNT 1-94 [Tanacetum coccineum]